MNRPDLVRLFPLTFSLLVVALAAPASAQVPLEPHYDRYTLSVDESVEVDNDLMLATLAVQAEDKDPAKLATRINETMKQALETLADVKGADSIIAFTRDYNTSPRYDYSSSKARFVGWQATQTLALRSEEFAVLTKAIGLLQESMQLQELSLVAKEETRKRATDALIVDALAAFDARAKLVAGAMGAKGHRVVEANVQTQDGSAQVNRGRMMDSMAMEAASEPAIAAGTSRVTVQVYGSVELQR